MFSKFSIRTKLIALVSVLLIAPISLGAFAIYEMRAINESAQDIQMTSAAQYSPDQRTARSGLALPGDSA